VFTDPSGHDPTNNSCDYSGEGCGGVGSIQDIRTRHTILQGTGWYYQQLAEFNADVDNEGLHTLLDALGIIDPTPFSDGLNSLIYLSEGDYGNAGISAIAIIPYVGDAAKAGKYGVKILGKLDAVGDLTSQVCSFSEDTQVETNEGAVSIKSIQEGDSVLAYNEVLGTTDLYSVTAVWSHLDPVTIRLSISDEVIETTPEHPFYVIDVGWVAAGNLWPSAQLKTAHGQGSVQLVSVVNQPQEMWNLTVSDAHTYFVGDHKWLVHNACADKL
jgi:hypothetical protein